MTQSSQRSPTGEKWDATARPFNPFWRAGSDNMRVVVSELTGQLNEYETFYGLRQRQRREADQRTFERTVEAVICDLVHRELTCPRGKIHVSQSNQLLRKKSRYKGAALNRNLPEWLRNMASEEMDFLTYELGKRVVVIEDDGAKAHLQGTQTLIGAGPKILSRMKTYNLTLEDVRQDLDQEVILLKAKKTKPDQPGKVLEFVDTSETKRLRAEMRRINEAIAALGVECSDEAIDTSQRVLRRVFNNGSFDEGGRLYGGFWQPMGKEDRPDCLVIDGEPVVELDYGQMSVSLLYGLAGTTPPDGDLYDLSAHGFPVECRPGIKKIMNAQIASAKPLTRMPKKTRKTIPRDYSYADVKKAVWEKHAPIVPYFGAGTGPRLMKLESDILVCVLLRLIDEGVGALPIHDAILVRQDQVMAAKAAMEEVFQEEVGIVPEVSVSSE